MTSSPQLTNSLLRRACLPVGGTFHFEILVMPPLTKTCPKMVLSHKGGSLCVKDVFVKKFLVPGEIPLAARSHRFFGNTLLKAGHLMRSSVVSGTVRGLASKGDRDLPPDSKRFRSVQRIYRPLLWQESAFMSDIA